MGGLEDEDGPGELVPVLSVSKNETIIRSILLHDPNSEGSEGNLVEEQILMVGRHPDCHIVVDHPSISRWHLQIQLHKSSQRLLLTDLSSVHGTWVCGERATPQVPLTLGQNDTFKLGASSRVYTVQWVPFSSTILEEEVTTYPIMGNSHTALTQKEVQAPILPASVPETSKKECGFDNESTSVLALKEDGYLEAIKSVTWNPVQPTAPPLPRSPSPSSQRQIFSVKNEANVTHTGENHSSPRETSRIDMTQIQESQNLLKKQNRAEMTQMREYRSPLRGKNEADMKQMWENQSPLRKTSGADMTQMQEDQSPLRVKNGADMKQMRHNQSPLRETNGDDMTQMKENRSPLRETSGPDMTQMQENRSPLREKNGVNMTQMQENQSPLREKKGANMMQMQQNQSPLRETNGADMIQLQKNQSSLRGKKVANMTQMQQNQSPLRGAKRGEPVNIWSRRQKSGNLICLHTARLETNSIGQKVQEKQAELGKKTRILKENSSVDIPKENNVLYNKENRILGPGKRDCLQELQQETSAHGSSSTGFWPEDDDYYPSDKENMTPPVSKEKTENCSRTGEEMHLRHNTERVPFQSLSQDSKANGRPTVGFLLKNSNKSIENHRVSHLSEVHNIDHGYGRDQHLAPPETKRKWHIVVDTGCLLDMESRQALKQLEGIKGTRLIIPRIVIRELDCLKRQKTSKKQNEVQGILRWIEDCMVKIGWWIHVQKSTESLPVGVTPPASPHSRQSDGSNDASSSVAFSSYGNFMDVLSPTAEDHILECALLFKKIAMDGNVVLLTNDVALKIKAMAEGMICENAKEFCASLVSPYSERFLWAQSTPRGHNWVHFNHTNNFNTAHFGMTRKSGLQGDEELRKRSNEGAKGLKLILRHNSQYGQKKIMKN